MSTAGLPARRPGGRRPVPPLVFLLILAVLALGVWWKVLRTDEDKSAQASAPCTATASPNTIKKLSNLKNVKVRVLNGSSVKGLAAKLEGELNKRGFSVVGIGNAPVDRAITGPGEIHYAKNNLFNATVISKHAGGFELVVDPAVKDGAVNLVIGQEYKSLTPDAKAKPEVKKVVDAAAKNGVGCGSPSPAA